MSRLTGSLGKTRSVALVSLALVAVAINASIADAAAPIKQVPLMSFGWEVNKSKANTCIIKTEECQTGQESSKAGGFAFPGGVAVGPSGNFYVADTDNNRVEIFTKSGEFVSMFGGEVNKTTKANICTKVEEAGCGAGVAGSALGQMTQDFAIAIDQVTGNVWVQDFLNSRIDEFSSTGEPLLTIGAEVNETKDSQAGATEAERSVCTAASGDKCKAGTPGAVGSLAPGAFKFAGNKGNLLAVGGPQNLLYVGDEHRVQEFDPSNGSWVGEIPLTSISSEAESRVVELALNNNSADAEFGYLYLVYRAGRETNLIRKFKPNGEEVKEGSFPIEIAAKEERAGVGTLGLAVDSQNRVAVASFEENLVEGGFRVSGSLFDGRTGHPITEFATRNPAGGLAFGPNDEMYAVSTTAQEVVLYEAKPVAELMTDVVACEPGSDVETSVTFDCTLKGDVDPWGVDETEVWFEWGKSRGLGEVTSPISVPVKGPEGEEEPFVTGTALVASLRPNSHYFFRFAGFDKNVKSPETPLSSETASFTTPFVPPRIAPGSTAKFVKPTSAVLFGELNPENASTEYFMEIAQSPLTSACPQGARKEACSGVATTPVSRSHAYGSRGLTQDVAELHPSTTYHFRISAESESVNETEKATALGEEAEFTTPPAAEVRVTTGGVNGVTSAEAVIEGSIETGGLTAAYTFEVGVYAGAATQYGVVFSGSVPASTGPVSRSLAVVGLQPGTIYAYRIQAENGYGSAFGDTHVFETNRLAVSLPETLSSMIPVPSSISFPTTKAKKAGLRRSRCIGRGHHGVRSCTKAKKHRHRRHKGRAPH